MKMNFIILIVKTIFVNRLCNKNSESKNSVAYALLRDDVSGDRV